MINLSACQIWSMAMNQIGFGALCPRAQATIYYMYGKFLSAQTGITLRPTLFLLLMNAMSDAVSNIFIKLYADNTLLCYSSDDVNVIQE